MQRRKTGMAAARDRDAADDADADDDDRAYSSGGSADDDDGDGDDDDIEAPALGAALLAGRAAVAKRRSGLSPKVVALLVGAAVILYMGFLGGERIAQALSWDSEAAGELGIDVPGDPGFSSRLEDDDDDDVGDEDDGLDYPQRLHAYYKKHNPQLLADVPMILARYAGNEKDLFAKLEKKYGDPVLPVQNGRADDDADDDELVTAQGHEEEKEAEMEEERTEDLRARSQPSPRRRERVHQVVDVSDPDQPEEEEIEGDDDAMGGLQEADDDEEGWPADDDREDEEDEGREDSTNENFGNDESPDAAFDVQHEIDDGLGLFGGQRSSDLAAGRGQVKVIGIGFPGTGIDHVHRYIQDGLKWNVAPRDEVSSTLRDIISRPGLPGFDKFDSYEAVVDDTTPIVFEELLATYPKAKVVLAVRPVDEWYEAFKTVLTKFAGDVSVLLRKDIYEVLLGNLTANEFVWKKQYQLFYHRALHAIPRARRKLICVYAEEEDRWDWLGRFLTGSQQPGAVPPLRVAAAWRPPRLLPSRQLALAMRNAAVSDPLAKLHELTSQSVASTVDLGALRVIGAGLDATGGAILAQALKKLGYKVASQWHEASTSSSSSASSSYDGCTECRKVAHNLERVLSGEAPGPVNFGYNGIFHGVDAIVGSPASMLIQEAARFNPDAKIVLTVRNLDVWWKEMRCRMRALERHQGTSRKSKARYSTASYYHRLVFGSEDPTRDFLHKRKYRDHLLGLEGIAPDRILVIDLTRAGPSGDAWRQLCRFLRSNKCTPRLESSAFPSLRPFCARSPRA